MGTLIHATGKRPHHIYRVYGAWGERRFPEVRSRADLYALLRRELGMPATADRTEVVMALLDRDWDHTRQQWVDDFRTQLKQARAETQLSQAELAERAGLSVQAIATYEQGTSSPTWGVVRKLSRVLGKQFAVTSVEDIPEDTPTLLFTPPLRCQMFAAIVAEINAQAAHHRIRGFQEIRKSLGKPRYKEFLHSEPKYVSKEWTFHRGGRKELQFNVGLEPLEGKRYLRHGVAFSFEPTRDPNWDDLVKELVPKVPRFNEFLRIHPDEYRDLRMWHWWKEKGKDKRSEPPDQLPSSIPQELIGRGRFIFLGQLQPIDAVDCEVILADFDRLLPLYEFVEGTSSFPTLIVPESGFHFQSGYTEGRARTTANVPGRELDVNLRHNLLREALHRALSQCFGADAVGTRELPNGIGGRIDAVVEQGGGDYWFYEIKTALSSARACIREALGQLLEYAYWPGAQEAKRLIIVGEPPLDDEARKYLKRLRQQFTLPIYYQQLILEQAALVPAVLDP